MSTGGFDPRTQDLAGAHAIEASAGTGKTYAITLLWLRLLLATEALTVDQILVSTFTKAATAELRDRLLATLRQARRDADDLAAGAAPTGAIAAVVAAAVARDPGRDFVRELAVAESNFDLAPISTIHGFCTALIARHSLELGADPEAELAATAEDLLDPLIDDLLIRSAATAPLSRVQARTFARIFAREAGVGEDRLLLPQPSGHDDPEAARDHLRRHAEAVRAAFLGSKKIQDRHKPKALERLQSCLDGGAPDDITAGMRKALGDDLPEALAAMETILAAHQDARCQAICDCARIARDDLAAEKQRLGLRTYDDLLLTVRDALADPLRGAALAQVVRGRYQAVIIDECQDSDGVQIAVFRQLFLGSETRCFVVIGDPKQSIYRFRGADLASYRRLVEAAHAAPEMAINWRSDPALIAALNRCYEPRPDFPDAQAASPIRYRPVAPPAGVAAVRLHDPGPFLPGTEAEDRALIGLWSEQEARIDARHDLARQVADECRRLLRVGVRLVDREDGCERPLVAGDIAVLAGSREQLRCVRRALALCGIPCQLAGRGLGSVLDSDEAQDLHIWLEALAACETGGAGLLGRLVAYAATPLMGGDAEGCLNLAQGPGAHAALGEGLRAQAAVLRRRGPLTALVRLLATPALRAGVLACRQGERLITNWRHVGQILQDRWAAGLRDPAGLALALGRLIGDHDGEDEAVLMRLETDLPAVQLSTIHGSKGLEYPVVFCPYGYEAKSRTSRKQRMPVAVLRHPDGTLLDAGSSAFDQHREAAIDQEDEEQHRLLYVALTRARHRCYVGLAPVAGGDRGARNGAEHSALARLLGLEDTEHEAWPAAFAQAMPLLHAILAPAPAAVADVAAGPAVTAVGELCDPPVVDGRRGPPWRIASYSSLSAGEHAGVVVRDRDEGAGETAPVRDAGLLAGLGAGTALGDRVHAVCEQVIGNRRPLTTVIDDEAEALFHERMRTLLDSPVELPGIGERPSLAELAETAIAELHFLLPVAACDPVDLSRALLADPAIAEDARRRSWAESVAHWHFARLRGFLQGYIDLVVCRQGRWFVIDYKTNQLPAYDPEHCEAAMVAHQYLLQGRLYLVALHRHLRRHLADYDPAAHLGGIAYLFVRGFPDAGCWAETPSPAAVAALDGVFAPVPEGP